MQTLLDYLYSWLAMASIVGISILVGDARPIPDVVAMQNGDNWAMHSVRMDDMYAYRIDALLTRQPSVLAIGSSRANMYRSMFFNKDSSVFYNAHIPTAEPDINIQLLKDLAGEIPLETVIWTLDHHWFNDDWNRWYPKMNYDTDVTLERLGEGTQRTVRLLNQGKYEMFFLREPLYGRRAFGVEAVLNGVGYRNDGSMQMAADFRKIDPNAPRFREGKFWKLNDQIEQYSPGSDLSTERLQILDEALGEFKGEGINIIGVLPPFAPAFLDRMRETGDYAYIDKLPDALAEIFAKHDMPFYDFTDPRSIGGTDYDMADDWHAGEKLGLNMYIQMLKGSPEILGEYSDLAFLQQQHDNATNQFEVFGTQF